jgi:hypothetical protein
MTGDQRLTKAFYDAAIFLLDRIENHGWSLSSNYLREHVRCATGIKFTNSRSPEILRALRRAHPEIAKYVSINSTKAKR